MNKLRFAALGAAAALTLGACGSAPSDSGSSASPGASGSSDFVACMVSDAGGIDDRSFNANAYKGVQDASAEFGIQEKFLESKSQTDYTPNINALVNDDCGIIVTVGFLMEDATKAAAKQNPEEKFAIVDAAGDPKLENMKGLLFNTAQSSFLAGYLGPRRAYTSVILGRAEARGEIRPGADPAWIADLLTGPLLMRAVMPGLPPADDLLVARTVHAVLDVLGFRGERTGLAASGS